MRGGLLAAFLLALAPAAQADEEVTICYNYGCLAETTVRFDEAQLAAVRDELRAAGDAAGERDALARAMGELYRIAGGQSIIRADRRGDLADEGVNGKMDCIDHAASTTRLLEMIERRGWLRFHRVVSQARRTRLLIFQHFSAVVEELQGAAPAVADGAQAGEPAPARYVIDSWFVEQGEPAVVLPLAEWLDGEGPYVP
jgi:hypothetical protein